MKYIILDDDDQFTCDVPFDDQKYLEKIKPNLKPLTNDEYFSGLDKVLMTAARFSYVIDAENLLWCIEWEPGFIVVSFSPEEGLSAVAVRALNPCFGGREATEEEMEQYDEDDVNPQYNIIFDPWDAQFDEGYFSSLGFSSATPEEKAVFAKATSIVESLRSSEFDDISIEVADANITEWAGGGIVVEV